MRVTNQMLSNNFLRDMRTNLNNMNTLQGQMTSGKQIRKPSDDPFKASRIMQMHSDIDANKQYNNNIKDSINWLDTTDTALGQVGNVVGRIEELLVSAGNGAYSSNERTAIKDEINQKIAEVSQILNTSFDGKYIFGGTRGTSKPMDVVMKDALGNPKNTELIYNINPQVNPGDPTEAQQLLMIQDKRLVEVSQGVTMEYNVNASQVINYGTGANENLMELFKNITTHLGSTDPSDIKALTTTDLSGIKAAMTNVLKVRSEVGSKQNRMESAESRNIDENFNMTEILTRTEDIDITEKTMEYATMQTIYMASLQTSAKVLQPSLLDYLR
jgi:flagellar hook-associated protein 3 FlgL